MAEGLRSKIAPLGRRLLSRERQVTRATGIGLARLVTERHKPKHLDAATRLAQGRSMGRRNAPAVGQESQGIVLLEAMAAGRPPVAFAIPGYRDVVAHDCDGWLVEPGNGDCVNP